jgi:hypothetical protein
MLKSTHPSTLRLPSGRTINTIAAHRTAVFPSIQDIETTSWRRGYP